ncbi:MAG: hypothetical protein JNL10_17910 [Verrucomicrobiales bacterium]|nr:hypothetical protein [Verrucomicrobiales bacterium]
MNGSTRALPITLTLVTALLVLWVITGKNASRIRSEQERHSEWISSQNLMRARARSDRELSALEDARHQSERFRSEVIQAAGGELAYALCDPGVSLSQSLALIAGKCLPPGTVVDVRVERFVEFEVVAILPVRATIHTMAKAARCTLIEAAGLIHSLSFVANGVVLARLDRRTIESVADWASIPESQLEALLSEGEPVPAPLRPPPPPIANQDADSPSPEMERIREVQAAFDTAHQQRIETMNAKAGELLRLADLGTLNGSVDINARIAKTRELAGEIKELRNGLLDPFPEMTQQLLNAGADPVLVRVMVRTYRQRTQPSRTALSSVLSSLIEMASPMEEFLALAGRTWGRWSTDPTGTRFTFEDIETRDSFTNYRAALDLAVSVYNVAITTSNQLNTRP